MKIQHERRRHARFGATHTVRFRADGTAHDVPVKNLSRSGMLLGVRAGLRVGGTYSFTLCLSESSPPVLLQGEVVAAARRGVHVAFLAGQRGLSPLARHVEQEVIPALERRVNTRRPAVGAVIELANLWADAGDVDRGMALYRAHLSRFENIQTFTDAMLRLWLRKLAVDQAHGRPVAALFG